MIDGRTSEALGRVKEFKYDGNVKLWCKVSKQTLLNNMRILSNDREALYLAKYAKVNDKEIEIYVKHISSEAQVINFIDVGVVNEVMGEEVEAGHAQAIEEEVNVFEEEVNMAKKEEECSAVNKVDDSEEERMKNNDDGFGMDNERVVHDYRNVNPILDRWSRLKKKNSEKNN